MAQVRCILGKFLRGSLPLLSPEFSIFNLNSKIRINANDWICIALRM